MASRRGIVRREKNHRKNNSRQYEHDKERWMGPLISGWMEETWFSWTASMSMTDIRTKGFLQKCASQKQNLVIRTPELKRRQKAHECKHCQDDNQGPRQELVLFWGRN